MSRAIAGFLLDTGCSRTLVCNVLIGPGMSDSCWISDIARDIRSLLELERLSHCDARAHGALCWVSLDQGISCATPGSCWILGTCHAVRFLLDASVLCPMRGP